MYKNGRKTTKRFARKNEIKSVMVVRLQLHLLIYKDSYLSIYDLNSFLPSAFCDYFAGI